ncbi:MAG: AAA family ATPase [Coprobacillaceae bacterium]
MECIILVGIPATGKTEFYINRLFKTHMRINLDMIKTRKKEAILVDACLKARQSFVVDNTNPTIMDRKKYLVKAKAAGFKTICYYFESTLGDAITRNDRRKGIEKVPIVAIRSILARLEIPSLEEGFDELYFVHIANGRKFVIERQFEN